MEFGNLRDKSVNIGKYRKC